MTTGQTPEPTPRPAPGPGDAPRPPSGPYGGPRPPGGSYGGSRPGGGPPRPGGGPPGGSYGGPRPGGGPPRPGGGPPGGRPRGRRFYPPRRRVCVFCAEKGKIIDYKDVVTLQRFISDNAKMETRRRSGTCARHQRVLSKAIKRARTIALLPMSPRHHRTAPIRVV